MLVGFKFGFPVIIFKGLFSFTNGWIWVIEGILFDLVGEAKMEAVARVIDKSSKITEGEFVKQRIRVVEYQN